MQYSVCILTTTKVIINEYLRFHVMLLIFTIMLQKPLRLDSYRTDRPFSVASTKLQHPRLQAFSTAMQKHQRRQLWQIVYFDNT